MKKALIIAGFAVAIWAFCAALIGIGRQFFAMETALILHAVGAPLGAAVIASVYFRSFGFTGPLTTAVIFVATALALDVLVVALLVERSFEMFASLLGVWIPLSLIFGATYLTGLFLQSRAPSRS